VAPRQTFQRFLTVHEADESMVGDVARDVLHDYRSGCLFQVMVGVIRLHMAERHPERNAKAFEAVVREWRNG
jgi:hypothetical protein